MKLRKISLMMLCSAFIMMFAGFFVSYNTKKFLSVCIPAEGVVLDITEDMSNGVRLFYPVIEFKDKSGVFFRIKPRRGNNPSRHKIGDKVPLFFDPMNPENARMDKGETGSFFSGFLFAFGGIFLVSGCGLFIYQNHQRKSAR